jgi:carboxymethylenebutenolidase
MRSEWVDAPFEPSSLRLWIEYPAGTAPAPVVLVLQDEPGLDDWVRSAADQLALEGFIAVAPDLFSGFGPNGGNHDSFRTPDEALRVGGSRLTPDEAMRRALAAAAFAQGLPRANGAIGSIGFGTGGTLSFRLAAAAPSVDAAVVFYGAAPERAVLEQVTAPVVGFYGEEDEDVVRTLAPAEMTMGQLGKPFEVHRYPGATHFFLRNQIEGENMPATLDAWPRATAFLGEHLQITAGGQ